MQIIERPYMNTKADIILEPSLEICDAHHHIWDFPNSTYMAPQLLSDLDTGHNVTSTIYMECGYGYDTDGPEHLAPVGETRFIDGLAAKIRTQTNGHIEACKSIVGYADLCLGTKTRETLEAHIATSSRFSGVRHATGWDADINIRNAHTNPTEGLMLTEDFAQGIRVLTELNLSFDAWLYHPQIKELTTLAKKAPNQIMVLDHIGGPIGIGSYSNETKNVYEQWKTDISSLAEQENVYVKLGGLAMPFCGMGLNKTDTDVTAERLAQMTGPYYLHVIEKFGVDRCMFESNFPVDKVGVTYSTLWNSFKYLTLTFSRPEKHALFSGTAKKVYL